MGRNKKYKESKTATSEAQKAAARAYYERNKEKNLTISITQKAEQAEQDKKIIAAHGLTPLKFWRQSIERLTAQPLPTSTDTDTPTE